jgi:siderophore synthetase component
MPHPGKASTLVATKLAEALWREDIGDARRRFHGTVHAFDRIILPPVEADPVSLVDDPGLRAELSSAVTGLELALSRRGRADVTRRASGHPSMISLATALGPDAGTAALEQLATEGHNLHPCGRTRLGWDRVDLLQHDLEAQKTKVHALLVPDENALGDDLSELLGVSAPAGTMALPVHAWQLGHLRKRYPELFADGVLRVAEFESAALITAALRTVLLPSGQYLKLSLDVQITSTRRTISIASTRNGPVLSAWVSRLLEADPDGHRLLLMLETAGVASTLGTGRELSTIVRQGFGGRLEPGEVPVPGIALPSVDPITGRTVLAGLLAESGLTSLEFFRRYAALLLPAVLRLAAQHGIGLEAHLQNCVPTFKQGRPHRMGLRDLAGLRIFNPQSPPLWPGSVIGTDDRAVMLSKVAYTAFQAHLGELVLRLELGGQAWQAVREIVDEVLAGHPDHAFYTAEFVPHKALTRMRLAGTGDLYIPVRNPLYG